ncbi:MAG: hypothetical protein ACLGIF_08730 [Actinomycetes bacterium]
MLWVLLFGGIALVGLAMVVAYGVWLAHKAADVMSEVRVLADRAGQLAELAGQIEVPEFGGAEPAQIASTAAARSGGDVARAT